MEFFLKEIGAKFVSKHKKMAVLFSPLTIRGVRLKNRLVVSPMCQYSSENGYANDWHLVHLGGYAVGGAGLVFTEATAVTPEGRISPDDLGIWEDGQIDGLKRITKFIKTNGSVPGIQLAHAGRKASQLSPWKGRRTMTLEEGAWPVIGPSAIPYKDGEPMPQEMSLAEIQEVKFAFLKGAERALAAGFEVIEIHAAHGYLLNEFLSLISNQRNDEYGGSFENRCRLLLEIVKDTREKIPASMPLFVRISSTDWVDGGWDVDDSVALAKLLKPLGVDVMDCSSGGNAHHQKIDVRPMYQILFSEKIKKEADIKTTAVGLITNVSQAESILENSQADLILLGRQFLREPYFPLHAAKELGVDIEWPNQYERAKNY